MIIVLKPNAKKEDVDHLIEKIKSVGLKPWISEGVERSIIGVIGEEDVVRDLPLEGFAAVEKVMPILKPYKLASRDLRSEPTEIKISKDVKIGGKEIVVMAGPCSVENRDMLIKTAESVKKSGAKMLRGGAFKPRSSPYSFQGLGEEALRYLAEARDITGLAVVTELMDIRSLDIVARYTDMIQIGARNMQNYDLLKEVGKTKIPVLLKRGMANTIKEFLMSAEYILSSGNPNVVFCERGIRTFEDFTRFTLDINAVSAIKELSHLPIVIDPSHGTGRWGMVASAARAGVAAGCDGLMIEVHPNPEDAFSDGDQSLLPEKFDSLMKEISAVAKAVGRSI
ncbi:MAG: 3-deoxy-7-phosphoheptulonate synthase [Candidatus Omnitrophota bacterium]|nr:3-deoxy-7-phosphoheptulonate synthase [Candidatus Omnitrophota bacterium]